MRIAVLVFLILLSNQLLAQYGKRYLPPIDLIGRANVGFGFNYEELDFQGEPYLYSPGGGMGLEIGAQTEVYDYVYGYFTVGWHQNLRIKFPESQSSDDNVRSTFLFARFPLTLGANYVWEFDDPWVKGIIAGGGMAYNIPGRVKIIENDDKFGRIGYKGNIALLLDLKIRMEIFKGFYMDPGIRYRTLRFNSEEHTKGSVKNLPDHLRTLKASGLDFSATFVYELDSKRR